MNDKPNTPEEATNLPYRRNLSAILLAQEMARTQPPRPKDRRWIKLVHYALGLLYFALCFYVIARLGGDIG